MSAAEPLCSEIECGQQRDHPNHNSGNPDGHFFHVGKPLLDPTLERLPPPVDEVPNIPKPSQHMRRKSLLVVAVESPAAEELGPVVRTADPAHDDGLDEIVVALKLSLVKARAEKASAAYLVGAFLLTATAPMTTSELSRALSAQEGRYVAPPRVNGGLRTLLKQGLVVCLPKLNRRGRAWTDVNAWWPSDSLAAWVSRQGVTE